MNISSRCDYACRAVIELARHYHSEQPQTATSIAERQKIPEKYLVHILLQLKRAGLVRSVRGAQGGYLLDRAPDSLTLLDVVTAVDGPVLDPLPGGEEASAELAKAWRTVARGVSEVLESASIQSIVDSGGNQDMYFI